jgi:thiamine pyrophosphokinase
MMGGAPSASQPRSKVRSEALVFTGGDPPDRAVDALLPIAAYVIAADSGVEHAQAFGRHIDLVVGDLDSVDPVALTAAAASGAVVDAHPVEKDATDLELALTAARSRGAHRITVVGGYGGRLDHFLANLLVLASAPFDGCTVDAWIGSAHVTVVRGQHDLHGRPGSLCSLLAVGGTARGVTTTGLRYPLDGQDLPAGSTRGVSNELLVETVSVSVRHGTVLVIQPDALEEQ